MRLIDADKLTELCDIMAEKYDGIGQSIWEQFRTVVEWSPTVEAAEEKEKRGRWICNYSENMFECSICGERAVRNMFYFCPWCGARMREKE